MLNVLVRCRPLAAALIAVLALAADLSARTVEVRPAPDALRQLETQLRSDPAITEVVLHEGVYHGSLNIARPADSDSDKLSPLVVRAAENAEVVIDGALPVTLDDNPQPVEGAPGVYVILNPIKYRSTSHVAQGKYPRMWDRKTRRRYTLVADARTVKRMPGSFAFHDDVFYFHTDDSRAVDEHGLEVSMLAGAASHGVLIQRPNTTVRGLHARSFFENPTYTAGIAAYAARVVIEDCVATNCPRGFVINGPDVTVRRCRAYDVGTGLRGARERAVVENCHFSKVRDDFTVPIPPGVQEDTGILIYHPTKERAELRGNVISGFASGVYLKCEDGEYILENNTIINTISTGLDGVNHRRKGNTIVCSNNLLVNVPRPIQIPSPGGAELVAQGNVFWGDPWQDLNRLRQNMKELNRYGKNNTVADPRLADPAGGDYRLLPDSPCFAAEGKSLVGALGSVPAEFVDRVPPRVNLGDQPRLLSFEDRFLTSADRASVRIAAHDDIGRVTRMRVKVGKGDWSNPLPPSFEHDVDLPRVGEVVTFSVKVADDAGNWSPLHEISLERIGERPQIVGEPVIRTNAYGAIITFTTNAPCMAGGSWGEDGVPMRTRFYVNDFKRYHYYEPATQPIPSREHVLAIVLDKPQAGRSVDYRVDLSSQKGTWLGASGAITFKGDPRTYHVSETGVHAEDSAPWRTLQYAVDRALPGDTIILADGVFTNPAVLTHGGVSGAPITIRAATKQQTVLDGMARHRHLISLVRAPHVVIEDFEMRWFSPDGSFGAVYAFRSDHVTVRGCKIWNAFWWQKRQLGRGVFAMYSPHLTVERNLIFKCDMIMLIYVSPNSRVVHNTATGSSHGGVTFEASPDSIFRYNDMAYQGNDVLSVRIDHVDHLQRFDCDYNNLGTYLRNFGVRASETPNCTNPNASSRSKAVVFFVDSRGTWEDGVGGYPKAKFMLNKDTAADQRGDRYMRFRVIEDWRQFSGLDEHSLFVDSKRLNMPRLQFELMPDSPLIGAGPSGETIGAMGVWESVAVSESREPVAGALIDAWFVSDAEGFTFADDPVRPDYADGQWSEHGVSGGALRTVVGGVDKQTATDMIGGWRKTFTVAQTKPLQLSVRIMLQQSPGYEDDEHSELRIIVDGKPIGSELLKLTGDGNAGGVVSSGWMTFDVLLDPLTAGRHELTVATFNNKKTSSNEWTELLIDRVLIAPAK